MNLIINRSRWLRGEGACNSMLRRPSDGKMCCLGFLGAACGVPEDAMLGMAILPSLEYRYQAMYPELRSFLVRADQDVYYDLALSNDYPHIPDMQREEQITELMKQLDVDVEFVD